eukprot:GILI01012998.1.p1 GENE.GILI01012998.1~~GILI01012998.1.p1  ORF type:complete len:597 (-),score=121.30 GILI01012998.1:393-2183(-)
MTTTPTHRRSNSSRSSASSGSRRDLKLQDVLLWEALDDPPIDRSCRLENPYAVAAAGSMFIVGGNHLTGSTEMYEFNFGTHSLLRVEMVESGLYPVTDGTRIFLFDLPCKVGSDFRYEIVEFNAALRTWRRLRCTGIAPKSREGGFSSVIHENSLYFFGGFQVYAGDVTGSFVYKLDLRTHEWTTVEYSGDFPATAPFQPFTGCRSGQSAVLHGSKVLVFGGSVLETQGTLFHQRTTNDVHVFDIATSSWRAMVCSGPSPPTRTGHVAVVLKDAMYVYGGKETRGGNPSSDVWRLSLRDYSWVRLHPGWFAPVPLKHASVCAAVHDGALFAYGMMQGSSHCLYRFRLEFVHTLEAGAEELEEGEVVEPTDILDDPDSADVIFEVEDRPVHCHRPILLKFSKAFLPLIEQAEDLAIPVPDISYDVFYLMMVHIYSGFRRRVEAECAFELLQAAHSFQLHELILQCEEAIQISDYNLLPLLEFAERVAVPTLKNRCLNFLWSNFDRITAIGALGDMSQRLLLSLLRPSACRHAEVFSIEGTCKEATTVWQFPDGSSGEGLMPTVSGIGGSDVFSVRVCMTCKQLLDFDPNDVQALQRH